MPYALLVNGGQGEFCQPHNLGVITNLPKKALLRRQFDEALKALSNVKEKAAAQSCMASVAVK